jgi:alanyl-tRNA synthetase
MKQLTAAQIRRMWIEFFQSKGHMLEKGAPLVPHNDPTLLWINSGVAALKKYFDGSVKPQSPRIVNIQKSIRTNDIERVGYTARHHTFFEMLGNFSIGDYFRKEAITWGFELLTSPQWFGFSLEELYITVHPSDVESRNIWLSLGVSPEHIISQPNNFWEIGEGPCGPNTEIFVDRGEAYDPNKIGIKLLQDDLENDRYIEIWNIVFSQFNSKAGLSREQYPELPQKNIDTGAGLERIACVMQQVETNFETDLFMPIINAIQKLANVKYEGDAKKAYRVIADHIRTCTFALADGALFSNEGRGYVLRRVLRRAVRYGKKLGINNAFMYNLVPVVVTNMNDYYGYVETQQSQIIKLVKIEEEKFHKTLAAGEAILTEELAKISGKKLAGAVAFKLYDTYGFPFELTLEIAQEKGIECDQKEFENLMNQQKERARNAQENVQSMARQSKDLLEFNLVSEYSYDPTPISAKVIALFKDGVQVKELEETGLIVFDKTNFYAESGGQVPDQGSMSNSEFELSILNVQKGPNKQHLHLVNPDGNKIKVGDKFTLKIDFEKRQRIMRHHSAAHLLQKALKEVLGDHISQAGSFVDDQKVRFDFTHFEKINTQQLELIEQIINRAIDQGIECKISQMEIEAAKKMGATALFSEKYDKIVRVVDFGGYSIELCGGTHVKNTADIGVFVIENEASISSGVRRIEGSVGLRAYQVMKAREQLLVDASKKLGALSIYEVNDRLGASLTQNQELKHQLELLKDQMTNSLLSTLIKEAITINGISYIFKKFDDLDRDLLIKLAEAIRLRVKNGFAYLINQQTDKVSLVASANELALKRGINCGNVIKDSAAMLGGKGGGKPEQAQAGAKDLANIQQVNIYLENLIKGLKP